jgi:hypothetical protein
MPRTRLFDVGAAEIRRCDSDAADAGPEQLDRCGHANAWVFESSVVRIVLAMPERVPVLQIAPGAASTRRRSPFTGIAQGRDLEGHSPDQEPEVPHEHYGRQDPRYVNTNSAHDEGGPADRSSNGADHAASSSPSRGRRAEDLSGTPAGGQKTCPARGGMEHRKTCVLDAIVRAPIGPFPRPPPARLGTTPLVRGLFQ